MSKKAIREINRHNDEMAVSSSADRVNRARSVTVGTAMNGVVEIMMRTDGRYVWAILSPSEVIELAHQLAASVGCHALFQPRNDFASWRQWNHETFQTKNYFPPLEKGGPVHTPQLPEGGVQGENNDEAVAVEAPKQRRKSKRAAGAS
jgi:hypothetical protein